MANDTPLVIYGAGGHFLSVYSSLKSRPENASTKIFITDDDSTKATAISQSFPELEFIAAENLASDDLRLHVAIGCNRARQRIFESLCSKIGKVELVTIIDCSSRVSDLAQVDAGAYIGPLAFVGPFAKIKMAAIVNTAAVVEHNSIIEEFCHIAPNSSVCGDSIIGAFSLIGSGAVVPPQRKVPPWFLLKAGERFNEKA